VAYVPGAAFYAADPKPNRMRLSFVTVAPERIEAAVAILGRLLKGKLA
jgi:2-aminoadipate transaminase